VQCSVEDFDFYLGNEKISQWKVQSKNKRQGYEQIDGMQQQLTVIWIWKGRHLRLQYVSILTAGEVTLK
jgi:hypothetical protein